MSIMAIINKIKEYGKLSAPVAASMTFIETYFE